MSGATIADSGMSSFQDYTASTSPESLRRHLGDEPTCLADYIQAWVQCGEGIRWCIGDFQTFLITVIGIVSEWKSDVRLLDYVTSDEERAAGADQFIERRPETVFGERDLDHVIVDPHFFAVRTFRWMNNR